MACEGRRHLRRTMYDGTRGAHAGAHVGPLRQVPDLVFSQMEFAPYFLLPWHMVQTRNCLGAKHTTERNTKTCAVARNRTAYQWQRSTAYGVLHALIQRTFLSHCIAVHAAAHRHASRATCCGRGTSLRSTWPRPRRTRNWSRSIWARFSRVRSLRAPPPRSRCIHSLVRYNPAQPKPVHHVATRHHYDLFVFKIWCGTCA